MVIIGYIGGLLIGVLLTRAYYKDRALKRQCVEFSGNTYQFELVGDIHDEG